MAERYAIYYAPEPGSDLDRFGQAWLRSGTEAPPVAGFSHEERLDLTGQAAFYGFHATLKAPFRLAPGQNHEALGRALTDFAATRTPALGPRLTLRSLHGFLALVPEFPCPEIDGLAWDCVRDFDRFRAPLEPEERARRRNDRLSPRQEELLDRFGYPFVGEEFRFHLTLTRRLPDLEQRTGVARRLAEPAEPACRVPLAVREICLFVQTDQESPFRRLSSHALKGGSGVADVYQARSLT